MKIKIQIAVVIISTFILFPEITLQGQNNQMNLEKYWHYRYRLVNYFMVVGDGPGESLPATVRNLYDGTWTLYWGECPRYLGWYIGVLATEYRLLANNGQDLNQTKMELYYTLKAIERLDLAAEPVWGKPVSSDNLNGFIIRDDVPSTFITDHSPDNTPENSVLNVGIPPYQWPPFQLNSGEPGFVRDVDSEWMNNSSKNPASQDQIEELLLGISLVKKCVDNVVLTFPDKNGNPIYDNLRQRAIDEADRILSYIREHEDKDGHTKHWQIINPNGELIGNAAGGDLRAFAQGFAHAGNFINPDPTKDYTNFQSETEFAFLWQNMQDHTEIRCIPWNVHIALGLAAISDIWRDNDGFNTTKTGIKFQGDYSAGANDFCPWSANQYGFDLFYGAVHRYLHNYDINDFPPIDLCEMQNTLNSAPWDGPYFHCCDVTPGTSIAPDGWGSTLRFSVAPSFPYPDQTYGDAGVRGNYNGLDYMLFHNLYYLLNSQETYFSGTFPHTSTPFGSCEFELTGFPPVGSYPFPLKSFTNTSKHINVDNLNVTNLTENCVIAGIPISSNTFYGNVRITGGVHGVTLTNTHVSNGGRLHVSTLPLPYCSVNPDDYIFDPFRINGNNNNSNNAPPPYVMTDEFKQIAVPALSVYPNPCNGIFIVESKNKIQNIRITDVLGNVIYQSVISSSKFAIDLSSRPRGIYFLKVITRGKGQGTGGEEKIYTEKIILQ